MNKLYFLILFIVVSLFLFFQKETLQQNPKLLIFVFPLLLVVGLQLFVARKVDIYADPLQQQLESDYWVKKEKRNIKKYRVFLTLDYIEFKTYKLLPFLLSGWNRFRQDLFFDNSWIILKDIFFKVDIHIPFKKIKSYEIEKLNFGYKMLHLKIEKYIDIYIYSEQINDILREIKRNIS